MTNEQSTRLNLALEKIEDAGGLIFEVFAEIAHETEVGTDKDCEVLEPILDTLADMKQQFYVLLDL